MVRPKAKRLPKRKFKLGKLFWGLAIVAVCLAGSFVKGLQQGRKIATHYYTDLPNSCFVESMIHASRANLILGLEMGGFSSVYGFTYRYADDYRMNKTKSKLFGHAVCIFEYKDTLWLYDPVWGTMPVGKPKNRYEYDRVLRKFIEDNYQYKLEKSFVVDDWMLPTR